MADPGFDGRGGANSHKQGQKHIFVLIVRDPKYRAGVGPGEKKMEIRKCLDDF